MTGIFETGASIQVDINIILQIVMFLIIVIGLVYKRKNRFKVHGGLMGIAIILHVISFLVVMGPIFFMYFREFTNYISYPEIQTT